MPLYEYKCTECGLVFDQVRPLSRISESDLAFCPRCGFVGRRQMAAANFKIKGYSEANGYAGKGPE